MTTTLDMNRMVFIALGWDFGNIHKLCIFMEVIGLIAFQPEDIMDIINLN